MSNRDLSERIIKDIGGIKNIASVTHCSTRLRFVLNDIKSADTVHLREVRGVLGVLMSGDRYMVVIGNDVKKIYDIIKERLGNTENKLINSAKSSYKHIFVYLFLYLIAILKIAATIPNTFLLWNRSTIDISAKILTSFDLSSDAFMYTLPPLLFRYLSKRKRDSPSSNKKFVISSPVKGKVEKLSKHPEMEFANGTYGFGVIISPESDLIVAPVCGKIISITSDYNAVTILSDGIEILVHVCGDVDLGRKLFRPFVTAGDTVRIGDPLFEFEKNTLEINGATPFCTVLVTNSKNYSSVKPVVSIAQEQQPLMEITFD